MRTAVAVATAQSRDEVEAERDRLPNQLDALLARTPAVEGGSTVDRWTNHRTPGGAVRFCEAASG